VTVPKGPGVDFTLPFRVASLLRAGRVEIVHTHNPQALIYGAPAGKLAHAVVVHTKHGANPAPLRRLLLRRAAAQMADAYVAVSEPTAEASRQSRDCSPHKLLTITNGVDVERFSPNPEARAQVREALGLSRETLVFGTVGRLAEEKAQDLLLRAAAPHLHDGCRLLFVGGGPKRGALEALAERLQVEPFVHFVGFTDRVADYLAALDVFVLSSDTEGLPLVIVEAMATELAIVSTDVGGIGSVIEHERTGLLIPRRAPGRMRQPQLKSTIRPNKVLCRPSRFTWTRCSCVPQLRS
jgi:glycosyltransferase involved in cell wall biosynthesis